MEQYKKNIKRGQKKDNEERDEEGLFLVFNQSTLFGTTTLASRRGGGREKDEEGERKWKNTMRKKRRTKRNSMNE